MAGLARRASGYISAALPLGRAWRVKLLAKIFEILSNIVFILSDSLLPCRTPHHSGPSWRVRNFYFGLCWPILALCWPMLAYLGSNLSQLGLNMPQLGLNLAQLGPKLAQLVSNLAQLGSNLAQLGPTWPQHSLNIAQLRTNLALKIDKNQRKFGI